MYGFFRLSEIQDGIQDGRVSYNTGLYGKIEKKFSVTRK
jgi:hypothetical protein